MLKRRFIAAVAGLLLLSGIVILVIAARPDHQVPRSQLPTTPAPVRVDNPAAAQPSGLPTLPIPVKATEANVATLVGRHFWTGFPQALTPCADVVCGNNAGELIGEGTAFAVAGPARRAGQLAFAPVKLDDGRVGFLMLGAWTWETEDPVARAREFAERKAKFCVGGELKMGMGEEDARHAWCFPDKINTTETAQGIRKQLIYPGRGSLYFENGRLVMIQ